MRHLQLSGYEAWERIASGPELHVSSCGATQEEVLRALSEGHALHLLPPLAAYGAADELFLSAATPQEQRSFTALCHQLVLDAQLSRSFASGSVAADVVVAQAV